MGGFEGSQQGRVTQAQTQGLIRFSKLSPQTITGSSRLLNFCKMQKWQYKQVKQIYGLISRRDTCQAL
jgi:hypothetical protein